MQSGSVPRSCGRCIMAAAARSAALVPTLQQRQPTLTVQSPLADRNTSACCGFHCAAYLRGRRLVEGHGGGSRVRNGGARQKLGKAEALLTQRSSRQQRNQV